MATRILQMLQSLALITWTSPDWPLFVWGAFLDGFADLLALEIANVIERGWNASVARAYRWLRRVSPEIALVSMTVTQQRIRRPARLLVISQRRREAAQPGPRWTVNGLPLPRTQREVALRLLAGGASTGKPADPR